MKNIRFSFGYMNQTKIGNWSFHFAKKYWFIPTWEVDLFKTFHNSNEYHPVKHSIYISSFRLYKTKKWRFEY